MLIFAFLVLLLIAAAVAAVAVSGDYVPVEMDILGVHVQTNSFQILIAGLIAGFVAGLMLGLARVGIRRRRARRAERRELSRQAAERQRLAAERDRLAQEKADLERHLEEDTHPDGGNHSVGRHGERPTTPA